MTDTPSTPKNPEFKEKKQPKATPRLSDLAAKRAQNLRDNLMRRKQQARERAVSDQDNITE